MDHALYRYDARPTRARQAWPGGQGLAAFVVLHLEHWEFEAPEGALRDPRFVGEFGSFTPDYRSWTQREYGLRVGIFRVIDALREAGIRPAIAANAMALDRLPGLVQTFRDWGCEWIAHGVAATRMLHAGMPPEQQRETIAASLTAIRRHTGADASGWLGQDWGAAPDTHALVAEAGLRYTLDWCNDDQPYWMRTTPPLLAIPLSAEWDDVQCQWLRNMEPHAHAALAAQAFRCLHAECARDATTAVFGLSLHPWVCGMPSRIAALRNLLKELRAVPDVWWTDPSDLVAHIPRN